MNNFLVPANTKRGTLIFGMLRPVPDAIILGIGTAITVITLLVIGGNTKTWAMIVALIPMGISVFLVIPLPYYHNVLCFFQSVLNYFNNRRNYIWKGWCIRDEFK